MLSSEDAFHDLRERLAPQARRRDLLRLTAGVLGVAGAGSLLEVADARKKKKKGKKKKGKGKKNQTSSTTQSPTTKAPTTQPPTTQPPTTQPPVDSFVFDQELGSLVDHQPELLREPAEVATDSSGNIYVTDSYGARTAKFGANGAYVRQFEALHLLTVDASGRLLVFHEIDDNFPTMWSIQVLQPNGSLVATLTATNGDGMESIFSVAVASNGHIFVSGRDSSGTSGLYEWDAAFTFVGSRITLGLQEIFEAIAIDSGNRLYAGYAGYANYPETFSLKVYALSDFSEITDFGSTGAGNGEFEGFYGIAADADGNVYVSDGNTRVQHLSWNGGFTELDYAGQVSIPGSWEDEFGGPAGVSVGNGSVYVADRARSCIRSFSPSLVEQGSIGEPGVGQFLGPGAAATDADGNVYVLDNNFVHKLTAQGGAVKKWGGWGTGANEFKFPAAIARSPANELYIADAGNARIQVYNTNGNLQRTVTAAQITDPTGVDFAADGTFIVTNDESEEIRVFTSGDAYDRSWSVPNLYYPELAISGSDMVYVADSSNDEIRIFTSAGTPQGSFGIPSPYGIAVDATGRVFVASWPDDDSHIFVRDSNGAPLFTVGTSGKGPGKISSPHAVHIASGGALLVSDYDNGLMRFTPGTGRVSQGGKDGAGQQVKRKQRQRGSRRDHQKDPHGRGKARSKHRRNTLDQP